LLATGTYLQNSDAASGSNTKVDLSSVMPACNINLNHAIINTILCFNVIAGMECGDFVI